MVLIKKSQQIKNNCCNDIALNELTRTASQSLECPTKLEEKVTSKTSAKRLSKKLKDACNNID